MTTKTDFTLSVCSDCFTYKEIHEVDSFYYHYSEDEAEEIISSCEESWKSIQDEYNSTHYIHLADNDYEEEFSTSPCDCCNSYSAGARYTYEAVKKSN